MEKDPRRGFLGEWDRLTPKMKLVAAILLVVPIVIYPQSLFLFLAYAFYLNLRDRRKD
jgi:hypothetical protein